MIKVLGYKNENDVMVFYYLKLICDEGDSFHWERVDSNYLTIESGGCNESFEAILLGSDSVESIANGQFYCRDFENDELIKLAKKQFYREFLEKIQRQESSENSRE